MFGKLKDKLKSWIKKSAEDIEETAEKVESTEDIEETAEEVESIEEESEEKGKDSSKSEGKDKSSEEAISDEAIEEKGKKEIKVDSDGEIESESISETEVEVKKETEKEKKSEEIVEEKVEVKEGVNEVEALIEKKIKSDEVKGDDGMLDKLIEESKDEDVEKAKEKKEKKKSLISKLKSRLSYKITTEEFETIFDDLEMLLLENNCALEVVDDIKKRLSEKLIDREINKSDLEEEIKGELKKTLYEILIEPDDPLEIIEEKKKMNDDPFVILFFGINGTGKTTSIAKIAHLLKEKGLSVVLAAADTFRAASIEQIQIHADKIGVPLIKQDYGVDPSAVAFDAILYAKKNRINVVLIDTAGRMHTKKNLLSEMEKICRVSDPDLKIFVAESIAGNDAVEQAISFHKMIDIDGAILSKTDIDDKGGTIISISHAINKPIFYLGTGQEYKDIKLFDKDEYIENLGL